MFLNERQTYAVEKNVLRKEQNTCVTIYLEFPGKIAFIGFIPFAGLGNCGRELQGGPPYLVATWA